MGPYPIFFVNRCLMSLRLAIVTDIHHGPSRFGKCGEAAAPLMKDFARFVQQHGASHVIDLGDRITDCDEETDLRLSADVKAMFDAVDVPHWHVNGNHDREHLSVAQNEATLGQSLAHEVIDLQGWRIILWRAETRLVNTPTRRGFELPETDLTWLAHQLQKADRPVLLCSHVPLSEHSQIGNYYLEHNAQLGSYPQAARVRAALGQARVPVVCIAGHVHWNTVTQINGIFHLTQQSLTESFTTCGEPAAAMGILELGTDQVSWEVFGNDPFYCRLPVKDHRWPPVRPSRTERAQA